MTRRRWIADEVSGNHAALIGDHARHLWQVLRAQIGQQFEISIGKDVRFGKVTSIQPDRVEFLLGDIVFAPSLLPLTVAVSIFKFDRLEWAIEKCTELGVTAIIPLITARTGSHLASASRKRTERWRRIAQQAAEQSRRVLPPEISDPWLLDQAFALPGDVRIVLSETEQGRQLTTALSSNTGSVVLAFGPEGGWKEQELAAFQEAGWNSASLGPTILRAETAVIAAVAVCQSVLRASLEPRPADG